MHGEVCRHAAAPLGNKMGVVLIKWAWPEIFVRTLRALVIQPHHSKIPGSAPVLPSDAMVWSIEIPQYLTNHYHTYMHTWVIMHETVY